MEVGHPNHLLSRMILQVPPNLQNPRVGTCAGISFLRPEKTSIFLNEKTLKCAIDRVRGLSSFQIWEMDGNGWVTLQACLCAVDKTSESFVEMSIVFDEYK